MASVMRKGTFGHMQKVYTQISCRVSDVASDQGLHFLTLVTLDAHIFLAVLRIDVFSIVCWMILVYTICNVRKLPV